MKLTTIQQTVYETKEANIAHIESLLSEPLGTDVIVLPEMCLSPYQNDLFSGNAIEEGDDIFRRFAKLAKHQHAYLIAGSVPERRNGKLYNTTFVFDRTGQLCARYAKIHLFSITYPDGKTYDESELLSPGTEVVTLTTDVGTIGLLICFDIRYPILARTLRQKGAEILIVPAAFNTYTGPHHWELAFRARAVDNQVFTVGVSPSTSSTGKYHYYGHSIVVDPFGTIQYQAKQKEEMNTIELDMNDITKIRKAFPIISNEVMI